MTDRFENDPQIRCTCGELMHRNESCRQWECALGKCGETVTDQQAAAKHIGPFASPRRGTGNHDYPPSIPGYRWIPDGHGWGYYERVGETDFKSAYARAIRQSDDYYRKGGR